ncbi:MAG: general secretion pathway protein GspB [Telluria sp.]
MSYILEALKKAQAERQLGSTPGLHAVPPVAAAPQGRNLTPVLLGVGGLAVVAAVGAYFYLRAGDAVRVQPAPPAVAAKSAQPAPQPAPVVPAAPPPATVAAPAPTVVAAPAPPRAAPQPVISSPPVRAPATAADADASLPTVRELPDGVRTGLPQPALGGYIYSDNPADRLLLVDKNLRHEGEEVAPGLVLDKINAHYAVMNYRGTRYKVPY